MKVIQVEIEDWQAEVIAALADSKRISAEAQAAAVIAAGLQREVDSASRHLLRSHARPIEIEHRLAELFRR